MGFLSGLVSDDKDSFRLLLSVFVLFVGCLVMFVCVWGALGSLLYWGFGLGFGLFFGGCLMLVCAFRAMGVFGALRSDRLGLGYQLLVFVVGLGIFSFIWFALGWPADMVYTFFSGMYTFTGLPGIAVSFTRGIIRLLPAIMFFIALFQLWVSTHRDSEVYGF